jgi:phosphatidate cytidylyltransferase
VVLPSSYFIATLETFGMKWVALPAALVIINDTMAYFFGIAFGKHKLLPVISPSKTWEGFVGAALSTAVAAYFLLDGSSNGTMDAMVLSFMVSFIAPFGGFLASMIKRAYAQKDFGSLFPGHGGFVDRLDCQLVLAPMVFLYLSLTAKTN